MYAGLSVTVAACVLAVVVAVGVTHHGGGTARQPMTAADISRLEAVPLSTLTAAAHQVNGLSSTQSAVGGELTAGGRPELLYVGAEFCPYCAAERWAMTIALMKFGTFSNLQQTHSAQVDGDVGTVSYYGSSYSSPYLAFHPYELYSNQASGSYYAQLETLPPAEQGLWAANQPSGPSFPFVDFGGRYTLQGSQYPLTDISYKSFATVMGSIGNNDSPLGAYIDASAAYFIKYLCGMTQSQPAGLAAAVAALPASGAGVGSGSAAA